MGREELSRKLTGMAADVVRDCRVELALGWIWCNKTRDPLPRVPPDLLEVLIFVRDQGGQEVAAAYKGRDYFEDCLRLALRNSQAVGLHKTRAYIRADRGMVGTPIAGDPTVNGLVAHAQGAQPRVTERELSGDTRG